MEIASAATLSADNAPATLFVALELSRATWLVALHSPIADKVSQHRLDGGDETVESLPFFGVEFPECLEASVEGGLLLDPAHEDGPKRQVDLGTIHQVHGLERPDGVHDGRRCHRQPRSAQHAAEGQHGAREVAGRRHRVSSGR